MRPCYRSLVSLDSLAATELDLLVIGAGIHGAFAAWDAARRGWRVALVDRGDFGGASSANSLKIVHGGFRYLQHGDVARLRESSAARAALLDLAPHLVEPLPCVMPSYGRMSRGPLVLGVALRAYSLLSLGTGSAARRIPRGRLIDGEEYARLAGPLALPGARGGALWYDALLLSPDRLLIAVVRSAARDGANVANYVEATRLLRVADGARERVVGARLRDEQGREVDVRARLTLVAASGGSRALAAAPAALPPFARACNVVLRRAPPASAVAIPVDGSRRLLFAVPWRGRLMIGTSQHDEAVTDAAERAVGELLGAVNRALPALELRADEVALVHEGLLPGTADRLLDRALLIDHEARDGVAGVVTMIGVKWTTSQRTAARAVALCARRLRADRGAVAARLVGAPANGDVAPATGENGADARLWALYGTECRDVATVAAESPELAAPLAPGVPTIGAEIAWSARSEMVRHLADAVLRRTGLGAAGHPGDAALAAAARIAARALGWDAARTSTEIALVQRVYPSHRGD